MDGFQCARDACGLPLFVSAASEDDHRPRMWHVHATTPVDQDGRVVLDLKMHGRNGCRQPITIHPGLKP